MVRCLQLCVTKFSEWEEESIEEREIPQVIEEAQDILQSLIERMGKSDLKILSWTSHLTSLLLPAWDKKIEL